MFSDSQTFKLYRPLKKTYIAPMNIDLAPTLGNTVPNIL